MRYLMNSWYVAAFVEEVAAGATLERMLLGERVVLFRTDAGQLAALQGRCPHRFAPLVAGKVKGAAIECPYHGLQFGTDGACVRNPHGGGHIPQSARVRHFPVAERDGLIWIWMGEVERADPDRIADYPVIRQFAPTARIAGYLHPAANYELMSDNILDLSHADFLHPGSLATAGEVTRLRPRVEELGDGVRVSWLWRTSTAPPVFAPFVASGAQCDMNLEATWRPAANMLVRFACQPLGAEQPLEGYGCHLMTPQDEHTTHYFFVGTRNFLTENTELTRISREQIMFAFAQEDKPIIEGVQRNMGSSDLWALKPVLLACDAGAVQVRRKLSALIEEQ